MLSRVRRATVPNEEMLPPVQEGSGVDQPDPSLAKNVAGALSAPSATIHGWCASQDPFSVIGRYVRLDRRGMGCCPFGEHHEGGRDSNPSFRVYAPTRPGGSCWYCYVWGQGGNVFDFLCLYHDVDARTLWRRILAGEVF